MTQPQLTAPVAVAVQGIHKNRQPISLEITLGECPSEGKPVFTAVVRDVTERTRAEATLRKSNEEYRILFEGNPHPMWVVDEETLRYLAVNEHAVQHYGYSREEFLNMTVADIRPDEDVAEIQRRVRSTEHDHGYSGVWRHRKKDGSIIDAEISWHRISFARRPTKMVLASDVTERRRAEGELRESEERYRELFENANDIIYTHDLTGNFTSLNKSGE